MKHDRYTGNWFPAPREVDRELYIRMKEAEAREKQFPAPREVNRFFYNDAKQAGSVMTYLFPAPREVNRRLYCNTHK